MLMDDRLVRYAMDYHQPLSHTSNKAVKICCWTYEVNFDDVMVLIKFGGAPILSRGFVLSKTPVTTKGDEVLIPVSVNIANTGQYLTVHLSFCDNITVLQERLNNNNVNFRRASG